MLGQMTMDYSSIGKSDVLTKSSKFTVKIWMQFTISEPGLRIVGRVPGNSDTKTIDLRCICAPPCIWHMQHLCNGLTHLFNGLPHLCNGLTHLCWYKHEDFWGVV